MRQDQIIEKGFQDLEESHKYAIGFHDHEPLDIGNEESPYTICEKCKRMI